MKHYLSQLVLEVGHPAVQVRRARALLHGSCELCLHAKEARRTILDSLPSFKIAPHHAGLQKISAHRLRAEHTDVACCSCSSSCCVCVSTGPACKAGLSVNVSVRLPVQMHGAVSRGGCADQLYKYTLSTSNAETVARWQSRPKLTADFWMQWPPGSWQRSAAPPPAAWPMPPAPRAKKPLPPPSPPRPAARAPPKPPRVGARQGPSPARCPPHRSVAPFRLEVMPRAEHNPAHVWIDRP